MKRIILLFTVAAMMAMMSMAVEAGPALADHLEPFTIFDDEENDDVDVRFIHVDEDEDVDCDEFDDTVICFIEEDDDDDDDLINVLFDDRFDHRFDRFDRFDRRDHHRHR